MSRKASSLDCTVILLRAMWGLFRVKDRPKPREDDDAFVRYVWSAFDRDAEGTSEALARLRQEAYKSLGERDQRGMTFSRFWKSEAAVDMIWNHPSGRFHVTHPWIVRSPDQPDGFVGRDRSQVAREPARSWDGVTPATVVELVDGITGETEEGNHTTQCFFNNPWVVPVELRPGAGSQQTLLDVWKFEADAWVPEPVDEAGEEVQFVRRGRQAYTIMAIVRGRSDRAELDSIRLFAESGTELLPDLAIVKTPPDWGFRLDDRIPDGERLWVFYQAVDSVRDVHPTEERTWVGMPRQHRINMLSDLEPPPPVGTPAREDNGNRHDGEAARTPPPRDRRDAQQTGQGPRAFQEGPESRGPGPRRQTPLPSRPGGTSPPAGEGSRLRLRLRLEHQNGATERVGSGWPRGPGGAHVA